MSKEFGKVDDVPLMRLCSSFNWKEECRRFHYL